MDRPKLMISGCGWAPCAIEIGSVYSLISSTKGHAESMDLYAWKDKGKLSIKGGGRDPHITYWNGTYYLVRCNDRLVTLVTSRDFVEWSEPLDIFTAPNASWHCESPTLMRQNGTFYLFWCLWDSAGSGAKLPALYDGHDPSTYDYRTYVYTSDTPTSFQNRSRVTELKAHAPEIVQGEKGDYFISSADYPQRGINLARLVWKSSN
jgi:beta-fructofuranosidase